jgi:hypothetical protein
MGFAVGNGNDLVGVGAEEADGGGSADGEFGFDAPVGGGADFERERVEKFFYMREDGWEAG